jgi:SAM-dependent methyltransferase
MKNEISEILSVVAHQYPKELIDGQMRDIPRIAYNISLVLNAVRRPATEVSICDLGGGIGLFSLGCAALGFRRVVLVDDFMDSVNARVGDTILTIHQRYKVEVVNRDVANTGIADLGGGFDAVSSFDSVEHWHASPKKVFHDVTASLREGGAFVLGVPNCVNLRKRLSVPFGIGKWSTMEEWYESPRFRGHLREPDVDDLFYIARDMRLRDVRIIGRNWHGYHSKYALVRTLIPIFDLPLRIIPSLCADLYLVGRKTSS